MASERPAACGSNASGSPLLAHRQQTFVAVVSVSCNLVGLLVAAILTCTCFMSGSPLRLVMPGFSCNVHEHHERHAASSSLFCRTVCRIVPLCLDRAARRCTMSGLPLRLLSNETQQSPPQLFGLASPTALPCHLRHDSTGWHVQRLVPMPACSGDV